MYDNNVGKNPANVWNSSVIWRLQQYYFVWTLIMQSPTQQKTAQNHGPLFVIPWQIKLCCYFQVHCAYMCKEREMRNVYWEIWAQMKWENICEIFLPGFTLIPLLCFLLLFWVKPTSFYPYSTPWVKGRKGGMGCGVEIVNGYNLTYLPTLHALTFCRRKRFQHLQNEK